MIYYIYSIFIFAYLAMQNHHFTTYHVWILIVLSGNMTEQWKLLGTPTCGNF